MNVKTQSGGIKGRLIRGVKWNVLGTIVASVSNFATVVVAARVLNLEDFGALAIIKTAVSLITTVAGVGLGVTATKHIAELRNSSVSVLGGILGLCAVVAGVTSFCFAGGLFIFAPQIASYSLHAPQIADQLRMASFYVLFFTMNGYQIGALVGFESFSVIARINIIQGLLSVALTLVLASLWGLTGAVLALALGAVWNWFQHHLAIRTELRKNGIKIDYQGFWRQKSILAEYTFPTMLSTVIGALVSWDCNAFLVRQIDGLAQMAIYGAANNFRSIIMFVPSVVTRVVSPILCNLLGEKKAASYQRMFWTNLAISAGASSGVALMVMLTAPYLLGLFGKAFIGGWAVTVVVAVMAVIEVISIAFYQPLLANGKLWWQLKIMICWSFTLALVTYTTVGQYGAMGLAYAYLAAHIVSAMLYYLTKIRIDKRTNGAH